MGDIRTRRPADRFQRRYLQDHWIASRGGAELFERSARSQSDPQAQAELRALAADVREDRSALWTILQDYEVPPAPVRERLVSVAETVGRLKPNGSLFRRSPLSDLLELEALAVGVHAKKLGWLCLLRWAEGDNRLNPYQLELLVKRAEDQQARLEGLRLGAAYRLGAQARPA
jgi:hypothetical protein